MQLQRDLSELENEREVKVMVVLDNDSLSGQRDFLSRKAVQLITLMSNL